MSTPTILIVHSDEDVLARSVASFSGLPCHVKAALDAESAAGLMSDEVVVVIADVTQVRNLAGRVIERRRSASHLPALVLLTPFDAEPAAFQAGAVALMTPTVAPSEAHAIASLASRMDGLAALCDAAAESQRHGAEAMAMLAAIIERESGTALAWAQYHAASLLLNQGKLQEALEDLSALVDEEPTFWRAHERLAGIWDVAGDPPTAERHRAIARDLRDELARESDAALAAHPEAREAVRPASPEPDASTTMPEMPATVLASAGDVIVADDSELVREMLADVLERAGFAVRQAHDGSQAIDLAKAKRPDVVILDGLMPGKNGFEACKEIKDVLYPRNPPKVLIFSAIYTKQRQRSEAISLYKADEVLAKPSGKPLDENELLAAVRRHMPQ